ncbi:hypothetical protein M0R45_037217 [Rubus argutus]|uniref:Uncharacterized protein n=1 Tax=Rubus argutus TaxID=59490 RepID=A0AAW1W2A5_RUBAR
MSTFINAETEIEIFLKLTIIREKEKVLFAEANKDFVDNLLGIMTFPTSALISFSPDSFGMLKNISRSIEEMHVFFNPMKSSLLSSKPAAHFSHENVLLTEEVQDSQPFADISSVVKPPFFMCEECTLKSKPFYVAVDPKSVCPGCNKEMAQPAYYRGTPTEVENKEEGFVRSESKYIITDNLEVHPMLTSSLTTRMVLGAESGLVEEVIVAGTKKKLVMLELLKAAVQDSDTVLSDVFFSDALRDIMATMSTTGGTQGAGDGTAPGGSLNA